MFDLPQTLESLMINIMTPSEQIANDLQTRGLQRQGIADLWRREWKANVIVSLRAEHEELCAIHEAHLKKFPRLASEPTADDERAGKLAKVAWEMLRDTREMMMELALHPTRPRADGPSRPGSGRPRKSADPIAEAEIVSIVPRGTSPSPE